MSRSFSLFVDGLKLAYKYGQIKKHEMDQQMADYRSGRNFETNQQVEATRRIGKREAIPTIARAESMEAVANGKTESILGETGLGPWGQLGPKPRFDIEGVSDKD